MGTVANLMPNLPATRAELEERRISILQASNIGKVRAIYLELHDTSAEFRDLSNAGFKDQAVRGSLALDDSRQLDMILDYARKHEIIFTGTDADVLRDMNRVKREYTISRADRREEYRLALYKQACVEIKEAAE